MSASITAAMQVTSKLPNVGTTIFSVVNQLASQYDAINLGQGFPDFEPPPALTDALSRAVTSGHNQYAPSPGLPALREQIALKTERLYGYKPSADDEITIVSGASEAIYDALAAVVHPGDEVIVLDPAYDLYQPAIELQGARAVHVPLNLPDFSVDWQRVRDAVTARTRMLVINSPHNPSGAILTAADLEALAAIVHETGIFVLSDEVYQHIVYDEIGHRSVLRHDELARNSFVVGSLGKTYHCTGWKVGYCIAPPLLTAELRKVHQYITFCTFAPAQFALAEALAEYPEHYLTLPEFYQAKRDHFRALLAESRFNLLPTPGGYFQLVDYSAIDDRNDIDFSEWLVREIGVAGIPLAPFYAAAPPQSRLLRLCFAKSDATMAAAAERLCRL